MYNLKKNDFVLFNPERSPFGSEEVCVGILVSDPDFNDINGEFGASFEFLTVKEYFSDKNMIDNYIGRTGAVMHNFGECSEQKVKSLLSYTNF